MSRFGTGSMLLLWVLAGCGYTESIDSETGHVVVGQLDTLATTDSGLIGHPTDIAVAPDGEVYVSDILSDRILRFIRSQDLVDTIGKKGAGPGEFDGPTAIRAGSSMVWVVDRGNGRLQTLSRAGQYVSTVPLGPELRTDQPSIGPNGSLLIGTMGSDSSLAIRLETGATEPLAFGLPVVEPVKFFDMVSIKDRIAHGQIPEEFRNGVLVAEGKSGEMWIALQTEREIRRFAPDGGLLWALTVDSPELDGIVEDFFRRNEEVDSPNTVVPLRYFADLEIVGEELWVLLNTSTRRPATILRVSSDGRQPGSVIVLAASGARSLAVDETRSELYLGTPGDAQVLVAIVP